MAHVIARATAQLATSRDLRILEPSAGDGAFIRGLGESPLAPRIEAVSAVEVDRAEAALAREAGRGQPFRCEVTVGDVVELAVTDPPRGFDAAVGNPPFVRFQFVPEPTKVAAAVLATRVGASRRRVGNLWIPVLIAALESLRDGGAFSFVLPTEVLTGVSARAARSYLSTRCEGLTLDLFPPGEFPGVLQRVAVLSGRRVQPGVVSARTLQIVDHALQREWSHTLETDADTWTRYLLTGAQLGAFRTAQALPVARRLGAVAKFEVAAVTGANAYFSLGEREVTELGLATWATRLLPRIRHAPGLVYEEEDHRAATAVGARTVLLDFSEERPDPRRDPAAADYLERGVAEGLDRRYKTRIRQIWYRVPHVRAGELMMSKRTHHHPRVVANEAGAVTTDTIYRGRVTASDLTPRDVAATFHNSLTLLSAELSGRSFGGGVLELVPSEISRLSFPVRVGAAGDLEVLDKCARSDPSGRELITATNHLLTDAGILGGDLLSTLDEARLELQQRRFAE